MKHNYQNIIKKSYAKPVIEEVRVDYEMSLVMLTGDPIGEPQMVTTSPKSNNSEPFPESPKYREASGSVDSPFGGSEPVY